MLLGSFVEEYDKDEGDELVLVGSSDSNGHESERTMSPQSSHGEGGQTPRSVQRSPTFTRPYPRASG